MKGQEKIIQSLIGHAETCETIEDCVAQVKSETRLDVNYEWANEVLQQRTGRTLPSADHIVNRRSEKPHGEIEL